MLLLLPASPPVAETVKPTVQFPTAPDADEVSVAARPVTDVGEPAEASVAGEAGQKQGQGGAADQQTGPRDGPCGRCRPPIGPVTISVCAPPR